VDTNIQVTSGAVNAIVADGRTLFVGGGITRIGPATGSGVPVSTSTFAPSAGFPRVVGNVTAVAADGAGGWYIAGVFTWVGGLPRQNLAHITAANAVDGWGPIVDAQVLAMVATPTDVVIGGTFTTVNGLARPRLARLSRATGQVAAWAPAPSDRVSALATDGTTLYVAGWFSGLALVSRAGLAAFTLASNALTPWDPVATAISATLQIDALAVANGYVYVGGNFNHIGGQDRFGSAALLPGSAAATPWNPAGAFPFSVRAIQPLGDRVILAADFTTPGGLAAVDTASGARFPNWEPQLFPPQGSIGTIHALAALGGSIAVGGSFVANARGPGLFTGNLAVFDTSSSAPDVVPEPPGEVRALAVQGGALYIGGLFTSLDPGTCRNLVAVDAGTGQPTAWAPDATHADVNGGLGHVDALAFDTNRVYAVVTFTDPSNGFARSQVQAFSRSTAARVWFADCNAVTNALACRAGVVYAGGASGFLAALDATTGAFKLWAPQPFGTVRALLATTSGLVVGGAFTYMGVQQRENLALVDYATGLATAWNPGADTTVWALAQAGTSLYVGGDFAHAGGQPRARVAAFFLPGSIPLPWNPGADANVRALAADGANVYAGGSFQTFAGQPVSCFAGVTGATGAPLAWGANANGPVNAIAVANAHAFLGGQFGAVGTEPVSGLAGVYDPALLAVAPPPAPAARLAVGPSPLRGSGWVNFALDSPAIVWLRVFDISGRVMRTLVAGESRPAGAQRVELDRSGLAPGVYHLRLDAGAVQATTRFIALP
jgi:hypothetical protein